MDLALPLQRRLAIARALIRSPKVLMVDEPTAGLDDRSAADIVLLLAQIARERAVLLVTHHQRFASSVGGTTLLLGGGRIVDTAPSAEFFTQPASEPARQFVRTGGYTPMPGVPIVDPAVPEARSRFVGPRGFFWIQPGQLGGLPRPGIIDDLSHDLDGLIRLGVTHLLTLEETRTVPPDALQARGIQSMHFPIVDMAAPEIEKTFDVCREIDRLIAGGRVVAVHCRAGLGRTGTILAAHLVVRGRSPADALDAVRSINPRCVQSEVQVEFLRAFANALGALLPTSSGDRGSPLRTN